MKPIMYSLTALALSLVTITIATNKEQVPSSQVIQVECCDPFPVCPPICEPPPPDPPPGPGNNCTEGIPCPNPQPPPDGSGGFINQ